MDSGTPVLFHRYVRAEVLAGFVNGLFLIFTAFFIFSEGVEVGLAQAFISKEGVIAHWLSCFAGCVIRLHLL